MVVLHHFGFHPGGVWNLGPIGPTIFFVLSGYLVTRSLLGNGTKPGGLALMASFHLRRLCKLMPPLVVLVVLGTMAGLPEFANDWAWHLGFSTNFLMIAREDWSGAASHLWSLAVQEQFYLLWPLLLLFCPRRHLVRTILVLAALALCWRLACIHTGASSFARWFFLMGSLEAFAVGSLVALWRPGATFGWGGNLMASTVAIGLFLLSTALRHMPQTHWASAFVEIPETLAIAWLVVRLLDRSSLPSFLLSHPWLAAMGRISFGIFLYHTLVAVTLGPLLRGFGVGYASLTMVALLLMASLLIAAASHVALERPIQQWARTVEWPESRGLTTPVRRIASRLWRVIDAGRS